MKKKGKGKFPLKDLEPKSEEKVKGGGMVSSSVSSITTSTGPGSTTGTGGGGRGSRVRVTFSSRYGGSHGNCTKEIKEEELSHHDRSGPEAEGGREGEGWVHCHGRQL